MCKVVVQTYASKRADSCYSRGKLKTAVAFLLLLLLLVNLMSYCSSKVHDLIYLPMF